MSCYINFKPLGVGDDTTGPNDAVVHTFKDDFCESLVRESIQNSLDAHIEGSADLSQLLLASVRSRERTILNYSS